LVTQSENSAFISWKAVENVDKYEVAYRTATENTWARSIATGNSINLNNLIPQSNYLVKIRTFCKNGQSSIFSTTLQFNNITESNSCNKVPNVVSSDATKSTANISWTPVLFAITYEIQLRIQGSQEWNQSFVTPQNQYTVTNLTSNRLYEVRVKANCSFGTGEWSEVQMFKTLAARENFSATNSETNLSVYPNPNKGNFSVNFTSATTENVVITLVDVTGREVLTRNTVAIIGENSIQVELNGFSSGVYLLQMRFSSNVSMSKVVVE